MRNYIALFAADLLIYDDMHNFEAEIVVMRDSVEEVKSDIQDRQDGLPPGWTIEFGPPGMGPIIPLWMRLNDDIILNVVRSSPVSRNWTAVTEFEAFQDPETGLLMGESPRKTWSNGK